MRITIDIDGKNREWWAWSVYYMMRDSGEFTRVEIYRTRRGWHIIGYGSGMSEIEAEIVRRCMGDDSIRIMIDSVKHPLQPKQVLWTKKDGYEVELIDSSQEKLQDKSNQS